MDEEGKNCKEKKHDNLASNIFNSDQERQGYNPNVERTELGANTNWSSQAASAKIINKGNKVDTFKKKQQQLSSQVFEQTDYSEYVPMKKTCVDINNLTDKQRKQDHMYSDILGA